MAMDLNAKAAYIRGLMTGMEFDADSKNGKVIAAMMDLLEEMAATVTEHDDALDQVYDELETLDQDLDDVVSDIYGDDEEDDDEIDDGPLPFSSSEDLDGSDSYQASSSKADSSKERSAIDEALDLIAPFTQAIAQAKKDALKKKNEKKTAAHDCQYYSFRNFSQASQLGSFLAPFYEGESSLYKDSVSNNYYMILRRAEGQEDAFRRACNIAADFGVRISASYATPAYFREHFQTILAENAIEMLCELV